MRAMRASPLVGHHALVTGASRGIGAAIALELAELGARLTIVARSDGPLAEQRRRIEQVAQAEVEAIPADMSSEAAIADAVRDATSRFGPVTLLVNNAGAATSAPFGRAALADWQALLDVNLLGPMLCIQQVLPGMLSAGFGRIVNVASTAGLKGYPYVAAYCAAKHGLIGLTRSLALETARSGVTVNAVCPGFADTELTRQSIERIVALTGRSADDARLELTRHNPQGRLVAAGEVAQVVGWLCLPDAISITGQAIAVAGGEIM